MTGKFRECFLLRERTFCCVDEIFPLFFPSFSLLLSPPTPSQRLNLKVFHAISANFHGFRRVFDFSSATRDATLSKFTTFTLLGPLQPFNSRKYREMSPQCPYRDEIQSHIKLENFVQIILSKTGRLRAWKLSRESWKVSSAHVGMPGRKRTIFNDFLTFWEQN